MALNLSILCSLTWLVALFIPKMLKALDWVRFKNTCSFSKSFWRALGSVSVLISWFTFRVRLEIPAVEVDHIIN